MTKQELIERLHKVRKHYKNDWYTISDNVDNVLYKIKGHNTWLQRVEAIDLTTLEILWVDSGPMDCSVKQLNDYLNKTIK